MSQVQKSPEGLFIPKDLIADFEHVEVDTSHPHAIVIRSRARTEPLVTLLARIDQLVRRFRPGVDCWTRVVP
jgi:hypothetical protein